MKELAIGLTAELEVTPEPAHLASAMGNEGIHVVSSPSTILFIENAAHQLLDALFEEGEGSVGTGFELQHRRAAKPDRSVLVQVELVEINGNKLRFKAEVTQGDHIIMDGFHERAVIDIQRLLSK